MITRTDSRSLIADPESGLFREDPNARSLSYFCKRLPVRVDEDLVAELKRISIERGNVNVRLSLHEGPDATHHDMIVLQRRGTYVRPHRHEGKGEAFHMMSGLLGIACFDHAGGVETVSLLKPGEVFRVAEGAYHSIIPLSDFIIFHENKAGPFNGQSDNIYADWAPLESDAAGMAEYMNKMTSLFEAL